MPTKIFYHYPTNPEFHGGVRTSVGNEPKQVTLNSAIFRAEDRKVQFIGCRCLNARRNEDFRDFSSFKKLDLTPGDRVYLLEVINHGMRSLAQNADPGTFSAITQEKFEEVVTQLMLSRNKCRDSRTWLNLPE